MNQLDVLISIGGVTIYVGYSGHYVSFISDLDVCNDGSGPSHDDPSYQPATAYYNGGKYLNADHDRYIVVPPQVRELIVPVVMGCQARLTNLLTANSTAAVTGDIGPNTKTGEASYAAARRVSSKITHNAGDEQRIYLYELWPGKPAVVGWRHYKLEPAPA